MTNPAVLDIPNRIIYAKIGGRLMAYQWLNRTYVWVKSMQVWIWPTLISICVLLGILFVIRPFDQIDDSEDVATNWNNSISKLGITSIYPPQEDFYVGDIWAIISDGEDRPLLGKGIRIGHIARQYLLPKNDEDSTFYDTVIGPDLDESKNTDHKIPNRSSDYTNTSLVSFPYVNISIVQKRSLRSRVFDAIVGSSSKTFSEEKIQIKSAETYGVPVTIAVSKLKDWCKSAKFALICTDKYLRIPMSFAFGRGMLSKNETNDYNFKFEIMLVTRVYLAKNIERHRIFETSKALSENSAQELEKSNNKIDVIYNINGKSEVVMKEEFTKPVAFGFKAISIDAM